MARTVKILVSGRVQGVYFRRFTKNKADELGITGTVRNMEDGQVEIIAQADREPLEAFIKWCHKGPITARVDNVELTEIQTKDNGLHSFVII
jgi:acylphosphatase